MIMVDETTRTAASLSHPTAISQISSRMLVCRRRHDHGGRDDPHGGELVTPYRYFPDIQPHAGVPARYDHGGRDDPHGGELVTPYRYFPDRSVQPFTRIGASEI